MTYLVPDNPNKIYAKIIHTSKGNKVGAWEVKNKNSPLKIVQIKDDKEKFNIALEQLSKHQLVKVFQKIIHKFTHISLNINSGESETTLKVSQKSLERKFHLSKEDIAVIKKGNLFPLQNKIEKMAAAQYFLEDQLIYLQKALIKNDLDTTQKILKDMSQYESEDKNLRALVADFTREMQTFTHLENDSLKVDMMKSHLKRFNEVLLGWKAALPPFEG